MVPTPAISIGWPMYRSTWADVWEYSSFKLLDTSLLRPWVVYTVLP